MADKVPKRGVAKVVGDMKSAQRRLGEVERPTGTQYDRLVDTVNAKLAQIDQEVADAINANSYTKSVIDSKFSSVRSDMTDGLNGKANTSHTHSGSDVNSGTLGIGVNTSAAITTTGQVSGANVVGGNVFAQSLTTNITATRVALWGRSSDGFIGTASSSERFKTNVRDWDGDPRKILEIMPVLYQYREQVELAAELVDPKRPVPYRYDPAAHAPTELGFIAERLVELGFWEVIIWERDSDGQIVADDDGNAMAFGIHYHLIAVLQQKALQWLHGRLETVEKSLGITVG